MRWRGKGLSGSVGAIHPADLPVGKALVALAFIDLWLALDRVCGDRQLCKDMAIKIEDEDCRLKLLNVAAALAE